MPAGTDVQVSDPPGYDSHLLSEELPLLWSLHLVEDILSSVESFKLREVFYSKKKQIVCGNFWWRSTIGEEKLLY